MQDRDNLGRETIRSQAGIGYRQWVPRAASRDDFRYESYGEFRQHTKVVRLYANTVAALTDIHFAAASRSTATSSPDPATFFITPSIYNKLLIALNECSKWGRVAGLNGLARYSAQNEKVSDHICEQVVPQFQHLNGSVVRVAGSYSEFVHQHGC